MVFVKNNEMNLKQRRNNIEDDLVVNKLNSFVKKDTNLLQESSLDSTDLKTNFCDELPPFPVLKNNVHKANALGQSVEATNSINSSSTTSSFNPFTFKVEVNVVAWALFVVALCFRFYEIDHPFGVV